ncbi:SUN domain-containing ossification factor isoform X2 [Bombus pyrosoma]|uniref:SUN domain-containing ossification factor isoform X2 n=1 Tax=Bombus pyrosoma TaxID=396416 RepID=UPI001CB95CBC|nr:SUN domain-containing ossification factor isoform X2 [Bombus pyrosoma]
MKICITCVYWTLLFISVASSALLFIIVASENAQTNYHSSLKMNETSEAVDNNTLNDMEINDLNTSTIPIKELHDLHKLETDYKDHYYHEKYIEESAGFGTVINGEARKKGNPYKDSDIVAETLTQQPNLSQGISENDEATVLTSVNTSVAELQSLAESKLNSEFSKSRLFPKKSSILTRNENIRQKIKKGQEETSSSIQTPSSSIINEITETRNETNSLEEESLLLTNLVGEEETSEVVVVVRAEQASITTDGPELKLEESVVKVHPDEISKVDGTFATTSELSDTDAKARLAGENRDDAAAVVLGEGIVTVGSSNPHEDIPSFSEWTQKRLEEAERKKTHPNASVQNSGTPTRGIGGMKVRSKNYASPDCGAKLVAANPEARSVGSVLVSTRDEYMLNTCTSRIWFVVELCEAIQAKKIELANFELFSSSPKDFSVHISDRFPTRDWSPVGQFTAKNVKDIQSFALEPHLFGKFIKVELQTYYGSEHFCPISLFRAYGTSEFEVLETETENQIPRESHTNVDDDEDSDEEEILDVENGETPRNLFGSARDAVLSIMKKAAEVLVKSSDLTYNNITKIQQSIDSGNILENSFISCTTPRYTILCDSCSDQKFAKIFQLISCREKQLNELLKIDLVNRTLRQSGLCKIHGVGVEASAKKETRGNNENVKDMEKHDQLNEGFSSSKNFQLAFITSILKSEYIAALCNVLAIKERKVVMNTSHEIPFNNFKEVIKEDISHKHKEDYNTDTFQHTSATHALASNVDITSQEPKKGIQEPSSDETNIFSSTPVEISSSSKSIASQIKPAKTFGKEEIKNETSIPILEIEETIEAEVLTTVPVSLNIEQHPILKASEEPSITPSISIENSPQTTASVSITTTDSSEFPNDDVISDMEPLEFVSVPNKVEKVGRPDQEGKQEQTEILDQEIKLPPQDSLTFDNLLSDLKDLEGESVHIQNGPIASASVTQSTANTMPQKESVFLRLSNRIKALERNMSLSGQYLEELSRRYKKQVEEMQRSLERTVSAMSEETRKRDERESKRAEEISILKEKIVNLSNSMKNLLHDRDSWHGKISMIGQHMLLICSEVFMIYLILMYCWGNNNKGVEVKKKQQSDKDMMRRKSAENYNSHMKKPKKRRPSEIASHITGTYRELMIIGKSYETKKERKRKRKRAVALIGDQTNVNNDIQICPNTQYRTSSSDVTHEMEITPKIASSVEVLHTIDAPKQVCKRLKSAPVNIINSHDDNVQKAESNIQLMYNLSCADNSETDSIKNSELNNSCTDNSNELNSLSADIFPERIAYSEQTVMESEDLLNSRNISGILKDTRLSVTSSFMRTALSTRKKRKAYSNNANREWCKNSRDSNDKTVQVSYIPSKLSSEKVHTDGDTTTNGLLMDQSDESRSSSVTSISKKKEKKSTGFRKMVRKFF